MSVKFDKKTRDKIYARLRKISLKYESEILSQGNKALIQGIKKPSLTVSKEVRKQFADEIKRMMFFFFKQSYKGAKVQIKESVNASDIPQNLINAMQSAYVDKANKYRDWIQNIAAKLENQRFRDTVSRAQNIITASIEQGLTRNQMREALQIKFEDYNTYSLDRVITTEGTRAMNLGTVASCGDDENIVGYRWMVNATGCSICDAKMAETQGDGYIRKEDLTEDDIPPAGSHPNCNCSLEPVFRDEI